MTVEPAIILSATGIAAVAVVFAVRRGYLGRRRTTTTPVASGDRPAAEAETATQAAPRPSAIYETVHPSPSPTPSSPAISGAASGPSVRPRRGRTAYTRRSPPRRAASLKPSQLADGVGSTDQQASKREEG